MSIKDLTQKSFSVLIIRSFGVLLLFGFTLFITNFFLPLKMLVDMTLLGLP